MPSAKKRPAAAAASAAAAAANSIPSPLHSIRVGTLVNGLHKNPAGYIAEILPHGFESFSITFWQDMQGVDLKELAKAVRGAIEPSGAVISSLGMFGNPLEKRPIDDKTREGWRKAIDAAHLFGCNLVGGFTGRLIGQPAEESLPTFKKVFGDLAKRAADKGVRIAFENCSMGGNWRAGDWNIAIDPVMWRRMFDLLPADHLGLEWEPCHQMVQLIDPIPQLREWVGKIFHIHGKDATIDWHAVRRHGILGAAPFAWHRTPGFGDTNWTDVISILRQANWRGSIDIEGWHDPVYRGDLEMTGQVYGLRHLKNCRGGDAFVPNPE